VTATPYVSIAQLLGIVCADSPNPGPGGFGRVASFARNRSGPSGEYFAWIVEPCATWPVRAADRYTGPFDRRTANPVLVIGVTDDPATPYEGAVAMSRQLARARLLSVDGYGHTSLSAPGACAQRHQERYLAEQILPPPGTRCRGPRPFTGS
jgi:pimeloyl-ACP methyl ester carboxylesterase